MRKIAEYKLLILLIFSGIYLAFGINFGINVYDEGVVFHGASQVLNGKMPYDDFWTLYAPGQFFLNAISIKLFGYNLISQRIISIFIQLGIVFFSYLIIKNRNEKNVIWGGFAVAIVLGGFDLWGRNILTSIFLGTVSIYYFLSGIRTKQKKYFYYAFIFLGINLLFRHFLGGIFASIIFLFFLRYRKQFELNAKQFLIFILLIIAPFFIYLIFVQPDLNQLYKLLIYNPLNVFGEYRKLEGADFNTDSFLSFLISVFVIIYFIIPTVLKLDFYIKLFTKPKEWEKLILLIGVFSFNIMAALRTDLEHLMPSVIFSVIYISILQGYKYYRILAILILVSLPLKNKLSEIKTHYISSERINYKYGSIYLPKEYGKEYQQILDYLQDKEFYSLGQENDRIIANDVLIYYLLGKNPNNYYLEMHPGITTELEAQEKIVQELKNINYLLALKNEFTEPNKSSESSGVILLDNYIENNFSPDLKTKNYIIYKRN